MSVTLDASKSVFRSSPAVDPKVKPKAGASAAKASGQQFKREEFSTGQGKALRLKSLAGESKLEAAAARPHHGSIIGPGDKGPVVDEWQQDLVKLGYLSAKDAKAEKSFGPKTAQATRHFKEDHGLKGEQVWNHAADEMKKALAHAKSQGVSHWKVPYIEQMHSKGKADNWNEDSNCGPSSLAMIARAFGLFHGKNDGQLVNHLSELLGHDPGGKTVYEIQDIANKKGTGMHAGEVQHVPELDWVRKQLKAGKLIMAEGSRGVTLDAVGQSSTARGNHWIVIRGIAKNGDFLVSDPSTRCHRLTPKQLAKFFDKETSDGYAVAISKT